MRWILLIGRLLFGGTFIWAAGMLVREVSVLASDLATHSVPYPHAAIFISALLLALGGSSIVLGLAPRIGAGLIALFLLMATPATHAFWTLADPAARARELAFFMRNVAVLGAALSMMAIAVPWPWSVDEWTSRAGSSRDLLRRLGAGLSAALDRVRSHRTIVDAKPRSSLVKAIDTGSDDVLYVSQSWTAFDDDGVVIRRSIRGYLRSP